MKSVLVTGGAGYIGSHTIVELIKLGLNVISVDNFSNSKNEVFDSIYGICNKKVKNYEVDLRDYQALEEVFKENKISTVIHFAGLKQVEESFKRPNLYFENNVTGTKNLLNLIEQYNINDIIFSSSASLYGEQKNYPIKEDAELSKNLSPYAETKMIIEHEIKKWCNKKEKNKGISLRYFNPVGCHESYAIGEKSRNDPTNIMPLICRAASEKDIRFQILGDNYDTYDGTCLRDYIHVMDLASGHISAMLYRSSDFEVFNLGTGVPVSVLELIKTFKRVNDIEFHIEFSDRRKGDIPVSYADISKSKKYLGWAPKRGLDNMCLDAWKWHQRLNR